jgi:archaellum component FlaF (FlaF/FlaG flagellin family)
MNYNVDESLITQVANELYEQINMFYMFLVDSIGPDDYERMKEQFKYTESYEEHIKSLTRNIPSPETTQSQIISFLDKYSEFTDKEYIGIVQQLNTKIQMNREACKMQAYQILQQQSENRDNVNVNATDTTASTASKIEVLIGGKLMSFDTYSNPLMVSLYSLLLLWFSLKHYGEPPRPVVYTNTDHYQK